MNLLSVLFCFAIGLGVLWLICKLLTIPIKIIWKLVINAIVGALLLLVVNFVGGVVGLSIPITPISALLAGVFGIPGVVVLVIIKILF